MLLQTPSTGRPASRAWALVGAPPLQTTMSERAAAARPGRYSATNTPSSPVAMSLRPALAASTTKPRPRSQPARRPASPGSPELPSVR